jgi:NADPH:quinone reductase-like Zn-dependent oxidoreductase
MKATLYRNHGDVDQLEFTDVPTPTPGPGEALVRVAACGLNHLDVLQRRGPALIPGFTLPHVAGMDIAGTIEAIGPTGSDDWAPGDRVVLNPAIPCDDCAVCRSGSDGLCPATRVLGGTIAGGYAEYVLAPLANLYRVPDAVDLADAAVVPTVWMTAWHALVPVGRVAIGESVLVHAGASGVSTAAIQLAKAAGARVIATVGSAAKRDYVANLGADVVIDSSAEDVTAATRAATGGRGVDLVLDHVGPATWNAGLYSLAPRGRLVFFGNTTGNTTQFDIVYAYHFGLRLLGSDPYDRREFGAMLDAYWASDFVTPIDSEFALADARAAQERMEARLASGKIVLRP